MAKVEFSKNSFYFFQSIGILNFSYALSKFKRHVFEEVTFSQVMLNLGWLLVLNENVTYGSVLFIPENKNTSQTLCTRPAFENIW